MEFGPVEVYFRISTLLMIQIRSIILVLGGKYEIIRLVTGNAF